MVIVDSLVKAIAEYILDGENREEIVNELKRYKREFGNVLDYNWYKYGNILPYYSQIRDFYESHGLIPSDDNIELEWHFRKHIRIAIDSILRGEK